MRRLLRKMLGVESNDKVLESLQLLHKRMDEIYRVISEPREAPYRQADLDHLLELLIDIHEALCDKKKAKAKKK